MANDSPPVLYPFNWPGVQNYLSKNDLDVISQQTIRLDESFDQQTNKDAANAITAHFKKLANKRVKVFTDSGSAPAMFKFLANFMKKQIDKDDGETDANKWFKKKFVTSSKQGEGGGEGRGEGRDEDENTIPDGPPNRKKPQSALGGAFGALWGAQGLLGGSPKPTPSSTSSKQKGKEQVVPDDAKATEDKKRLIEINIGLDKLVNNLNQRNQELDQEVSDLTSANARAKEEADAANGRADAAEQDLKNAQAEVQEARAVADAAQAEANAAQLKVQRARAEAAAAQAEVQRAWTEANDRIQQVETEAMNQMRQQEIGFNQVTLALNADIDQLTSVNERLQTTLREAQIQAAAAEAAKQEAEAAAAAAAQEQSAATVRLNELKARLDIALVKAQAAANQAVANQAAANQAAANQAAANQAAAAQAAAPAAADAPPAAAPAAAAANSGLSPTIRSELEAVRDYLNNMDPTALTQENLVEWNALLDEIDDFGIGPSAFFANQAVTLTSVADRVRLLLRRFYGLLRATRSRPHPPPRNEVTLGPPGPPSTQEMLLFVLQFSPPEPPPGGDAGPFPHGVVEVSVTYGSRTLHYLMPTFRTTYPKGKQAQFARDVRRAFLFTSLWWMMKKDRREEYRLEPEDEWGRYARELFGVGYPISGVLVTVP